GFGSEDSGGVSSSMIVMEDAAAAKPEALAVTITSCEPSRSESSTTIRSNGAEKRPAGMMIDAGTIKSAGSLELRETVRSVGQVAAKITRPALVNIPLPSLALVG